ncbi:MAG: hypothetical protein IPI77_17815 [Saprospiraceae bacterium]|nr:hypothetical protein [Saprospiraceae bacterium]
MNDYKASSDRATITDADRIYPGVRSHSHVKILRILPCIGIISSCSLELFNPG